MQAEQLLSDCSHTGLTAPIKPFASQHFTFLTIAARALLLTLPQNLQVKRLSARRFNTTYCYDFPSVFENALRSTWAARAAAGEPQSVPPAGRLVEAHELVLASEADKNFTSNTLRLKRVERGPGNNDVGMVAWHMTLKTPECQQGRQVIAVANDITHKSGSFGPTEDALFRAAGELALEQRLPLVYLAANSGARVGLAEEVGVSLAVAVGHCCFEVKLQNNV